MRLAAALFLTLHGVAHLLGFRAAFWPAPGLPVRSSLFSGVLGVGYFGSRALGVIWLMLALGYLLSTFLLLLRSPMGPSPMPTSAWTLAKFRSTCRRAERLGPRSPGGETMSLPQSMPSLFGRFTAIWKDHEHLGTTLRELKALCGALEDGQGVPQPLEPARLFLALEVDLKQHFTAEESDEYFGTVLAEDSGLELEIDALKSEHATMLSAVDMLLQLAADPERWAHLPGPTRLLITQLERHEGSESKLLRSFFSRA